MRYWITLDALHTRISRAFDDLSTAMRLFCYSFAVLVVMNKVDNDNDFNFGGLKIQGDVISYLSVLVISFILLDLLQQLFYYGALSVSYLRRWCRFKWYSGDEGKLYDNKYDKSELIIKWGYFDLFSINIIQLVFTILKIVVIALMIVPLYSIIIHYRSILGNYIINYF